MRTLSRLALVACLCVASLGSSAGLAVASEAASESTPPSASESTTPSAAQRVSEAGTVIDRVVARVGDDPIFASDIRRVLALGLARRQDGESASQLERRVLEELIDQRLRLQAVERYDLPPPAAGELTRQLEELQARFGGAAGLEQRLHQLALDEESLRRLLVRQLRILTYIDQRLRPRIFVDLDAIRAYYDDVLVPGLARDGVDAPPLDQVEADIRTVLREQRLNDEIVRWTTELRAVNEVDNLIDRPERPLPPVVLTLEESGP